MPSPNSMNSSACSAENNDTDPWRFFCVIFTRNHAPLLGQPALMQLTLSCLQNAIAAQAGQLWGYVILPDSVQFVVEVPTESAYHVCVEVFKTASEPALCDLIRKGFEELVDSITYYHPARRQPIYLIWQGGYHTQALSGVYALSNKIADLVNKPVELGLVQQPGEWRFSSYQPDDDGTELFQPE